MGTLTATFVLGVLGASVVLDASLGDESDIGSDTAGAGLGVLGAGVDLACWRISLRVVSAGAEGFSCRSVALGTRSSGGGVLTALATVSTAAGVGAGGLAGCVTASWSVWAAWTVSASSGFNEGSNLPTTTPMRKEARQIISKIDIPITSCPVESSAV